MTVFLNLLLHFKPVFYFKSQVNNLKVSFKKHELQFKFDAGTSRGVLKSKMTYFILIKEDQEIVGIGEAAPLFGLSIDDPQSFESILQDACSQLELALKIKDSEVNIPSIVSANFPAIRFGLEMALQDYLSGSKCVYYNNAFVKGEEGIPINGLIWMSDKRSMLDQIKSKLEAGYRCIKMKIGALNFEEECGLLTFIRKQFGPEEITLRVDANGAFKPEEALEKLKRLSEFKLHSIEQPIAAGNKDWMQYLCENTPLDIALDEELIGVFGEGKKKLLSEIKPQFIILKPSLLGGFGATDEWIDIANRDEIGWWITSALEANIGLNAIAQYTYQLPFVSYQGLGTGQLYHNNIPSPLLIDKGYLYHNPGKKWELSLLSL